MMTTDIWDVEYNKLLEKEAKYIQSTVADERRNNLRFPIKAESVWIKVESNFKVVDISLGGVCLYSDRSFPPGHQLNMMLGKAFLVEADVIDCTIEETDSDLIEYSYRIRARFRDETTGKRLLVMIKEMDDLGLDHVED